MNFKFHFLIFLFPLIFSFCTTVQGSNYINYHLTINEAENYIKQEKYDSALIIYEDLQKEYPRFFYKDLHNFSLCYLKLNNISNALKIAKELVLHGYTLSDFEQNPSFNKISTLREWDKFVEKYPLLRKQYITQSANKQRDLIYNICLNDKTGTLSQDTNVPDSVSYVSGKQLEALFLEHGFPEFMINKDSLSIRMMVVIRHYYRVKYTIESFPNKLEQSLYKTMVFDGRLDSLLKTALNNGLIQPNQYVAMVTYDYGNNPYGTLAINFNYNTESVSVGLHPPSGYDTINILRKSIGLAPINIADTNALKHTWIKYVSIPKLKDKLKECKTCETMYDYLLVTSAERRRVYDEYGEHAVSDFLLEDISSIRDFYNPGLRDFIEQEIRK